MKKEIVIFITLIVLNCLALADNKITAQQYEYFNQTSTSLQDIIYEYHNLVSSSDIRFIFDFQAKTDGSDSDTQDYRSQYETKEGYEYGKMGAYQLVAGGQDLVLIGRQFGTSGDNVDAKTHDYAFMGRTQIFEGALDIVAGVNLHNEPVYDTVDEVKYFTDEFGQTKLQLVSSIKLYGANLSAILGEDSQKTALSYTLSTPIGRFTPQINMNTAPYTYYDSSFTYDTHNLYNAYFYLKGCIKHRTIEDNTNNYKDGVLAQYVEAELNLSILKIIAGYSQSTEFSDETLEGTMIKVGIGFPINEDGNKAGVYFGRSNNYYPDIVDTMMMDQEVYLLQIELALHLD